MRTPQYDFIWDNDKSVKTIPVGTMTLVIDFVKDTSRVTGLVTLTTFEKGKRTNDLKLIFRSACEADYFVERLTEKPEYVTALIQKKFQSYGIKASLYNFPMDTELSDGETIFEIKTGTYRYGIHEFNHGLLTNLS